MEKKVSVIEGINNLGLGIYVITIGSIGYLLAKGLKKLLDIVLEALLQKYIQFIRSEVEIYYAKMLEDISKKFVDRFNETDNKYDRLDQKIDKIERHETASHKMQKDLLVNLFGEKEKAKEND